MRFLTFVVLTAPLFVGSADAVVQGGCYEPRAPIATLRRPDPPYCVTLRRNCTSLDEYAWESAVRDYQGRLRDYAEEVDRYYRNARTYIQCMARLD